MKQITRRKFLKIGAGIVVASALPNSFYNSLKAQNTGPIIGVARGDRTKLVKVAVDEIGGIESFVKPGCMVCIKPNISFAANNECGTTTSPGIVRQMVALCLEAGARKVIIVDHTIANAALCIENSMIEQAVVNKKVVDLIPLSTETLFKEVSVPNGQELTVLKKAKVLDEIDVLINMPTAKSHSGTGVSLGIKSLMGLVWNRGQLHAANLHQAIAELATMIKPDLTVIDATRALVTGGPGGPGKTVALNTVVAGTDPVAVDAYTVGLTPWYEKSFVGQDVRHILAASKLGLGEIDRDKMLIREVEV